LLFALGAPVEHVPRLSVHAVTQPSAPPAPAVPVQLLPEQPGLVLSHLPLLHWLSALQTQSVWLELGLPAEHE
jgi:hypothetical protein